MMENVTELREHDEHFERILLQIKFVYLPLQLSLDDLEQPYVLVAQQVLPEMEILQDSTQLFLEEIVLLQLSHL